MALHLFLLFTLVSLLSATERLQEKYAWKALNWKYPNLHSREQAIRSGALIRQNALPVGIERWKNKLFITVPRWAPGIPATLNYIRLDAPYEKSPKLTPYPSWDGNALGNCNSGLNTVYRIKADSCDRLWVLDVGSKGISPNDTKLCPNTLYVYDLNTDKRIRKHVFRPQDIVPGTVISNIAVDEGVLCDDTFAYFADGRRYSLIAYSWEKKKSWRFSHSYFHPDPLLGEFNISNVNFQWSEGIFGVTVSPVGSDGYRTLYFSPLASNTEFAVSTRILRDESKVRGSYKDFRVVGVRSAQGHSTSKVIDDTGIQLFNLIDQNAIGCWSTSQPLKPQNIQVVDKDDVGLVFPSDIKIDAERNVWVISNRMPVFLHSVFNYSDINFRIYTAPLEKLVQGTVCQPQYRKTANQVQIPFFPSYHSHERVDNIPTRRRALYPQLIIKLIPKVGSFGIIPIQSSVPYHSIRLKSII